MSVPRVLVLRAPGTNCDVETAHAFETAGAIAERVHVGRLIENPVLHNRYQILCVPGGFSYGDDIAAGRILATQMKRHLSDLLHHFIDEGQRLVLGICNGMQVLMRLGVLTSGLPTPAMAGQADDTELPSNSVPPATLTWNNHGRFEDRWVHLAVDQGPCAFLNDVEHLYLPIAHAEGKFIARDAEALAALKSAGRLALRYCEKDGNVTDQPLPFPVNPNGADANVAGVCDATGRVFGLMPHPERHIDPTHHPTWTRQEQLPDHGDGLVVFTNAVRYFA
ncbi:MAG: phosphoribosylformylglycinamidine synthase I [Planctomycetota bacterium]